MVIQAIAALIFLPFIVGRSGVYHLQFGRGRVGLRAFAGRSGLAGRARLHWKG